MFIGAFLYLQVEAINNKIIMHSKFGSYFIFACWSIAESNIAR